jgi:glycosyltransferase involved in cell wall biosynthesis
MLERLASDPPDAFIANMVLPAAYYAGRWLREAGIPTIGICHVGADHFLYTALLDEFVLGPPRYRISALVCVSKYLERVVLERQPSKVVIETIVCGVPVPKFIASKPTGRLRLAYVGRLTEEAKRITDVANALCRAVSEVPDVEAFIYGDGEERPAVEHIIREKARGLPVHLIGRVEPDQIFDTLLNSHALVLLSDWEGLPVSVMEAMACGVVPIGLRHARGGAPELIENGTTGLLVDDRGEGFVDAVRRLRQDPVFWERLSRSARARVEAEYSLEACAVRWRDLLLNLASDSNRGTPVRIPRRLRLPAVHPSMDLPWLDIRRPSLRQRLIRPIHQFLSAATPY